MTELLGLVSGEAGVATSRGVGIGGAWQRRKEGATAQTDFGFVSAVEPCDVQEAAHLLRLIPARATRLVGPPAIIEGQ